MLILYLLHKYGNINLTKEIHKLLSNQLVFYALSISIILYTVYSSIKPNPKIVEILDNDLSRLISLFIIVGIAMVRFELGFLLALAFMVTIYNDKTLTR
jgi:hypothetical protein